LIAVDDDRVAGDGDSANWHFSAMLKVVETDLKQWAGTDVPIDIFCYREHLRMTTRLAVISVSLGAHGIHVLASFLK
jgi:hypothetical protein